VCKKRRKQLSKPRGAAPRTLDKQRELSKAPQVVETQSQKGVEKGVETREKGRRELRQGSKGEG
jgi:hypothetical protein